MSTLRTSTENSHGKSNEVQNENRGIARRWSALGWGLCLVLVGGLVLADTRSWLHGGEGWFYLAIGIGAIFVVGFLVQFFGNTSDRWGAFGSLIAGLSLIYVGAAFLYGFGDWWPLALVFAGFSYLAREIWGRHATREGDAR